MGETELSAAMACFLREANGNLDDVLRGDFPCENVDYDIREELLSNSEARKLVILLNRRFGIKFELYSSQDLFTSIALYSPDGKSELGISDRMGVYSTDVYGESVHDVFAHLVKIMSNGCRILLDEGYGEWKDVDIPKFSNIRELEMKLALLQGPLGRETGRVK